MSAVLGLTFDQKLPRIFLDSPQSQRCLLLSVLGGSVDQWRNLGPVYVYSSCSRLETEVSMKTTARNLRVGVLEIS